MCQGSQNFTVNCVKGHNFVFNWNMQAVHKAETLTKLSLLVYWQLKKSMTADPPMISMSPSYPTLNWVLRFFLQRYTCIRNACLVVCCQHVIKNELLNRTKSEEFVEFCMTYSCLTLFVRFFLKSKINLFLGIDRFNLKQYSYM